MRGGGDWVPEDADAEVTLPRGGGAPGAGDSPATGGVYGLTDPQTGDVYYVGRSADLDTRATYWARNPDTQDLRFRVLARTDDYSEQRGLEQFYMDAEGRGGLPVMNRIRGISQTNGNASMYYSAVDNFFARLGTH